MLKILLILLTLRGCAAFAATIGPVLVSPGFFPSAANVSGQGYLGLGHFVAYSSVCRYGAVAVDHDRILASISGCNAIATDDGGLTWRGIDGNPPATQIHGEILPPGITAWPFGRIKDNYRMNTQNYISQASHISNDLFVGGFFQCNDGGNAPIWMRRVRYDGQYWVRGAYSLVDSMANKCMPCEAMELPSGQLWFVWRNDYHVNGFLSGLHVKYSNDSGATWNMVNGARVLESYNNHVATTPYLALPYLNGVAILHSKPVSYVGGAGWNYSLNDSSNTPQPWSAFGLILNGYYVNSAIVRGSNYDTLYAALVMANNAGPVKVGVLTNGSWSVEEVGKSDISASNTGASGGDAYFDPFPTLLNGRAAVTSCGEDIYCLWADKSADSFRIYAKKRVGVNSWSDAITLVSQTERIYQLSVPLKCPAGYLPFFWDFYVDNTGGGLRFLNFDLTDVAVEKQPITSRPGIRICAIPNPFTSIVEMVLDNKSAASITRMAVYDIHGRVVRDLTSCGLLTGDRWSFTWDGKDKAGKVLASGAYLVRATADAQVAEKRFILAR